MAVFNSVIEWASFRRVAVLHGVVKTGAYRYPDGSRYVGDWNQRGQKHGMGHLCLPNGTRYDGAFQNGLCTGLGVMCFPDGAKYGRLPIFSPMGPPPLIARIHCWA
jgi:hypothetical protein